jgi:hypothetical protein
VLLLGGAALMTRVAADSAARRLGGLRLAATMTQLV